MPGGIPKISDLNILHLPDIVSIFSDSGPNIMKHLNIRGFMLAEQETGKKCNPDL